MIVSVFCLTQQLVSKKHVTGNHENPTEYNKTKTMGLLTPPEIIHMQTVKQNYFLLSNHTTIYLHFIFHFVLYFSYVTLTRKITSASVDLTHFCKYPETILPLNYFNMVF